MHYIQSLLTERITRVRFIRTSDGITLKVFYSTRLREREREFCVLPGTRIRERSGTRNATKRSISETHNGTHDDEDSIDDGVTSWRTHRIHREEPETERKAEEAVPCRVSKLSTILGGGRIKGHGDAAGLAGTGRGVLRL